LDQPRITKIFVDNTKTFVLSSAHDQTTSAKPTASELEILRVLWERGPSTVRDVHEALREKKDLGYTTVLSYCKL